MTQRVCALLRHRLMAWQGRTITATTVRWSWRERSCWCGARYETTAWDALMLPRPERRRRARTMADLEKTLR